MVVMVTVGQGSPGFQRVERPERGEKGRVRERTKGREVRREKGAPECGGGRGGQEKPRGWGWQRQRRGERDMEGKGRLGGYRKGEAWEPLRDPRSLGPLTRQPGRQAPPSPVATRRRQHPAGEDHALGVRGGRPLCHLCALETQNI